MTNIQFPLAAPSGDASIPSDENLLSVGLYRVVTLIAEKEIRQGRARGPTKVLRRLGWHPADDAPVWLKAGKHGPLVGWCRRYASLLKDIAPEGVTLKRALALLEG